MPERVSTLLAPTKERIVPKQAENEDSVIVAGVKVTRKSRAELTEHVVQTTLDATAHAPRLLFDLNGHAVGLCRSDPRYAESLVKADVVHVDSEPLVMVSRLLTTTPVRGRSATTDLFYDFAEGFQANGISCYFLGATDAVIEECVARMTFLYPQLIIAGYRNGYFDEAALPGVVADINATKADVLWVGLGKPKEQLVSLAIRDHFEGRWIITCGGCFDFAAGHYQRAPLFLQKIGLEWLHRMVLRPRQLFWRYLTTNPVALYIALRQTRNANAPKPRA
ncbi:exopolysaccharide biosynthesis WecB/TagA/CpsF family protein [Rhizobium sp. PP-CC-3G-465]|nr:exopolysaccharide biosynthesis WecB/TagA/CpsF family protein [Rhizobium sp. PP-CC-3G-465]